MATTKPLSLAAMRRAIASVTRLRCIAHTTRPEIIGREYAIVKHQTRCVKVQPDDGGPAAWIYFNHFAIVDEQTFQTLSEDGDVCGTYRLLRAESASQ